MHLTDAFEIFSWSKQWKNSAVTASEVMATVAQCTEEKSTTDRQTIKDKRLHITEHSGSKDSEITN